MKLELRQVIVVRFSFSCNEEPTLKRYMDVPMYLST